MADASRILELIFEAEDHASGVIGSISDKFDSFSGKIETATQPLADFTEGLLKFEATAAAGAVALTGLAIRASGDFDKNFREITTLVQGTDAEFAKFRDTLLETGAKSAFSFDIFTNSVYKAVSATGSLDTSLRLVSAAEKLGIAGRAELNDTTLLLASTLNAYGAGVDAATRFSDAFFTSVQDGQTTIPELSRALGLVAPTAHAAGLTIEDLAATLAILTKNGLGTSEAATGLKEALSNIIKPSSEAQDQAARLGLKFDQSSLSAKGFSAFIEDVANKTHGSVPAMSQLFGSIEGLNAALILAKDGGHSFADEVLHIGQNAGATETGYTRMVNTISVATQQLENALTRVAIIIGDNLRQPFIDSEHAAERLFDAIGAAAKSGAFDPLIKLAQDALKAFSTTIDEIAKNLPAALQQVDFTRFADALRDLAHEFGSLFGDIDLSTPEGLAKAIQGVVDTGETLVRITRGIVEAIEPVVERFVRWASSSNDLSASSKELIGNVLGTATEINKLIPHVNDAVQSFTSLAEIMGAGKLISVITNLVKMSRSCQRVSATWGLGLR